MELKKILVVNLDRIGDVVRSTFLFRVLKERYPDCYLACLASSPADILLRNNPYLDDVFYMPHQEVRDIMKDAKTILHMSFSAFRLFDALRLHQFDLVVNPFSDFGAIAVRYLKPRYMLGRAMDKQGKFVVYGKETAKFVYIMSNQRGLRSKFRYNFIDIYSRILKDIGISVEAKDIFPQVHIGPRDRQFAENFLADNKVKSTDVLVGFQIGAFSKDKMWPLEKFRKLAEILQNEFHAQILVTGSSYEARTIISDMTSSMTKKPIIAAGKTDLLQTAALINKCALFISNDTGPMHIAAALDIPVIALFGLLRTIPEESRPWGLRHCVLVKERVKDIPLDEVLSAAQNLLKGRAGVQNYL
ncbi:MAG: glycosyltransferase family 9 protein [Candidatus Omnitrophica bacterium]|nr:glycosyltransferase family 9 protein [Candidatus Omnitrophota bacterium]